MYFQCQIQFCNHNYPQNGSNNSSYQKNMVEDWLILADNIFVALLGMSVDMDGAMDEIPVFCPAQ